MFVYYTLQLPNYSFFRHPAPFVPKRAQHKSALILPGNYALLIEQLINTHSTCLSTFFQNHVTFFDNKEVSLESPFLLLFKMYSSSFFVSGCSIILSVRFKVAGFTLLPQFLEKERQSQTISSKYFFGIGKASFLFGSTTQYSQ